MTVDLTKPVSGQVIDGNVTGFSDLKFSPSPAKVELQWRNFYDPESTIRQYDVQVQRAPYVYIHFFFFYIHTVSNQSENEYFDICKILGN